MEENRKKSLSVGLVAHVDAGKTTLSESILYLSGKLRQQGRVDHGDAFLDNNELEKNRGITIFSSQAVLDVNGVNITFLDTPGHVDFSSEMERTLQVLDYAILVINGADGVQGHTRTLWKLLRHYKIPVFLFVNKMDRQDVDRSRIMENLKKILDEGCIEFDRPWDDELTEQIAMTDEAILDEYLNEGEIPEDKIKKLIFERKVFPCYFGSALKNQGVEDFLNGFTRYAIAKEPNLQEEFGAKVFKISRDSQGNRLTHVRVTKGCLKVKDVLNNGKLSEEKVEEKVNQIRIYTGDKYEMVQEAYSGMICALTGLTFTRPGQGLGAEENAHGPMLEPVLNYRIHLPEGCDVHTMVRNLRQLEEEDPMLRIVWNEENKEIYAQLMGEVQIEILQSLIKKRFDVDVTFDRGNIVYKETIASKVEGVGHFEPLRHYAEVHLLMEPAPLGSGIILDTNCSEDVLDKNWQRLILTHLCEKEYRGVLTGSVITDMKITLVSGRAHEKHTEGGDFRQATYRAVRQGLMQAKSVLLEPYYDFRLEIPTESVGRAITDIQKMNGEFEPPVQEEDMSIIKGWAPVAGLREYQIEVTAYTRGRGKLFCELRGYGPCHNEKQVISEIGYVADHDLENPSSSVFCAHGSGFVVPWNQVFSYMHLELFKEKKQKNEHAGVGRPAQARSGEQEEKELEEIFIRTYGKIERKADTGRRTVQAGSVYKAPSPKEKVKEYLLVDGYNVIFAWEELNELAKINVESARNKLMDILCNYQGFKKCTVILVFDAYRVEGEAMEIQKYHNIHVVYTKEAETADQYIEKVVHEIGRKYHVSVVTSDGLEQVITLGQGGTLISSREFQDEVALVNAEIKEECKRLKVDEKNYLFHHMDEELAKKMERIRLGEEEADF